MSAPESLSPLAHVWRPGRHGAAGVAGVAISARQNTLVQVTARHGQGEAIRAALKATFALDLPAPGTASASGDMRALPIAPETWLVIAPRERHLELTSKLADACGAAATLVDQSAGRVVLRVAGAKARDVLAKGCRVDLHPRVFGPGRVAVTPIAHVTVTVLQVNETPVFDLVVSTSYAETFAEWLVEASAEFGADLERL